jgi:hypothetical protein
MPPNLNYMANNKDILWWHKVWHKGGISQKTVVMPPKLGKKL